LVNSSVAEGVRGRRGRVGLGSTDEEFIGALNQGKSPADAVEKVRVSAAFVDWVVCK